MLHPNHSYKDFELKITKTPEAKKLCGQTSSSGFALFKVEIIKHFSNIQLSFLSINKSIMSYNTSRPNY